MVRIPVNLTFRFDTKKGLKRYRAHNGFILEIHEIFLVHHGITAAVIASVFTRWIEEEHIPTGLKGPGGSDNDMIFTHRFKTTYDQAERIFPAPLKTKFLTIVFNGKPAQNVWIMINGYIDKITTLELASEIAAKNA